MKLILILLMLLPVACAQIGLDSQAEIAAENCYSYRYGDKLRRINFVEAFDWCHRSADAGDPNSQTLLAELYYLGLGGKQDILLAEKWFLKAAKQGHPHSQFMLYKIYSAQQSSFQHEQGQYWLLQSRFSGYSLAMEVD